VILHFLRSPKNTTMVTPCDSGFLTSNIICRQTETFQTSRENFAVATEMDQL